VQADLEAARRQVKELQAQARGAEEEAKGTGALMRQLEAEVAALSTELRQARDDGAAAASKVRHDGSKAAVSPWLAPSYESSMLPPSQVAGAMQSANAAVAECDAAKATANTAVQEAASSKAALLQATARIQQLDDELAQLRADALAARREADTQAAELRRVQGLAELEADRVAVTETDIKQLKRAAVADAQRQAARVAELEALVAVLRGKADAALDAEGKSVRELQRQLDRAEMDVQRLRDRLADAESKAGSEAERAAALDKVWSAPVRKRLPPSILTSFHMRLSPPPRSLTAPDAARRTARCRTSCISATARCGTRRVAPTRPPCRCAEPFLFDPLQPYSSPTRPLCRC